MVYIVALLLGAGTMAQNASGGEVKGKVFDLQTKQLVDETVTVQAFQIDDNNRIFGDAIVTKSVKGVFTLAIPNTFGNVAILFSRFDARINADRVTRTVPGIV